MKMSLVTDAVRRDAFAKVRNCKKHAKDEAIIFKTVWQIIELANVARDGGLLALEEKIHERKEHDFISRLVREGLEQVIQGCDPDDVEELLTTMYWAKNPAGNKALAAYMMMRGICFIQAGVHPYVIEKILLAMLPQKYRGTCIRQLEDAMEEYRESVWQKEIQQYEDIVYSVQNEEIKKTLEQLNEILICLDARGIQRLLRDVYNDDLVYAMIGLPRKTRNVLVDNVSERLGKMMISDYVKKFWRFGEVYYTDDARVKDSAEKIMRTVCKLIEAGEVRRYEMKNV